MSPATEHNNIDPQDVIDWIEVHLAGHQLTDEQKAILRLAYTPGFGSVRAAADFTWRRYHERESPHGSWS